MFTSPSQLSIIPAWYYVSCLAWLLSLRSCLGCLAFPFSIWLQGVLTLLYSLSFAFIVTGLFDRKLFPRTVPQDLSRVPYSLDSFVQYWSGISSVTLINSIVLGRRESFLQWWMKLKLTGIPWAVTESTWESRVLLCILTDSVSLQKALVREKTIVVSIMSEHFTCHPASDRQEMPYLN